MLNASRHRTPGGLTTTHLTRLRLFRWLVLAALLFLGVCAVQFCWFSAQSGEAAPVKEAAGNATPTGISDNEEKVKQPVTGAAEPAKAEQPGNTATEPVKSKRSSRGAKERSRVAGRRAEARPSRASAVPLASKFAAVARRIPHHLEEGRDQGVDIAYWLLTNAVRRAPAPEGEEQIGVSSPNDLQPSPVPASATSESGTPEADEARLVLVNPAETGVELGYLVDGYVHTLAPGEKQELRGAKQGWQIRFHRGGEWDDAEQHLRQGTFYFAGTEQGWVLLEASSLSWASHTAK